MSPQSRETEWFQLVEASVQEESCTERMPATGRGPSSTSDAWKSEPHDDAQDQTREPDTRGSEPVPTRQEGHHRAHRTLERGLMVSASARGK